MYYSISGQIMQYLAGFQKRGLQKPPNIVFSNEEEISQDFFNREN